MQAYSLANSIGNTRSKNRKWQLVQGEHCANVLKNYFPVIGRTVSNTVWTIRKLKLLV